MPRGGCSVRDGALGISCFGGCLGCTDWGLGGINVQEHQGSGTVHELAYSFRLGCGIVAGMAIALFRASPGLSITALVQEVPGQGLKAPSHENLQPEILSPVALSRMNPKP